MKDFLGSDAILAVHFADPKTAQCQGDEEMARHGFAAAGAQPVGMLSAQLPGCLTVAVAESALRSVRSDALAQGTEEPRISNRETSIVAHTLCCDRREQKHNEQECVLTHGRRRSLGHGEFRWWHSSDADRPRGRTRAHI